MTAREDSVTTEDTAHFDGVDAEAIANPLASEQTSWGLVGLVALSVLATIIMLVSGSTVALKVALVAALWAAVLGIFLVTRYRREAAERDREMALREEAFTTELARVTSQGGGDHTDILASIQKDLASIRAQLEDLAGQDYTYVPDMVQAQARRIAELEQRSAEAQDLEEEAPVNFTQPSTGAPSADAIAGRVGTQPSAAARQDNPLASLLREREKEAAAKQEEPVADSAPETVTVPEAASDARRDPTFDTGSFQAVRWGEGGAEELKPKPQDKAADEEPTGRRRSDSGRAGSVSVAELLAALKEEK